MRKDRAVCGWNTFRERRLQAAEQQGRQKAYTQVTAAALRCKDEVMKNVELVQEGCSDILTDAKASLME